MAESEANTAGTYVKSLVFGGLDGIITTFAIVATVAGASLPPLRGLPGGAERSVAPHT